MITYIPLEDAEPSTLALARRRDDDNPLVGDLVELALEIASHAVATGSTPYEAT
jgi:hypothetical protein